MFSKFEISKKLRVHMPYTKYYTLSWSDNGFSEGTMQLVPGGAGQGGGLVGGIDQYNLLRELDESRCWRV